MEPTCFCRAGLQCLLHETDDFRDEIQMNALAFADTTHAISTLSIISKHHIFANSDDSARSRGLLDINARCVNLIEKRESVNAKCHRKNQSV